MIAEQLLKSIICFLFIIMALCRLFKIRPIGFSKTTVFSKLFLAKVYIQYTQAGITLFIMIMLLLDPIYKDSDYYDIVKENRYYSFLLLINAIAWIFAAKLMRYEYRKRLSEYLPHWIFWSLFFIVDTTFLFLNFQIYGNLLKVVDIVFWVMNLTLIVMMFMTKRRTKSNPRPEESSFHKKSRTMNNENNFIQIKMNRKLIVEQQKVMYAFSVIINDEEKQEIKLQKSYAEFVELESYVVDIINHYNRRNSTKFPLLSKSNWNGNKILQKSKSSGQYDQQIMNSDKLFLKRIEDLERFLKNLVQRQEFWTPRVFEFLELPQKIQIQLQKENNKSKYKESNNKRKPSYATKQSKVENGKDTSQDSQASHESLQGDVDKYTLIDDYIQPKASSVALNGISEDQEGYSLNQPFKIKVLDWVRASQMGEEYIEYRMSISFLEGQEKSWIINKRYSDFKELDQLLQKALQPKISAGSSIEMPQIPPRITNQDKISLDNRKVQLQQYIKRVFDLKDLPQVVLEFIDFYQNTQMNLRSSVLNTIDRITSASVLIDFNEVLIIDEKAKTFYILKVIINEGRNQQVYQIKKRYKDFQNFNHFIYQTFVNDPDLLKLIPHFPSKKTENGLILSDNDLQKLLEKYINLILDQPEFNNLICIKTFLSQSNLSSQQSDSQLNESNMSPLPSPMQNMGLINRSIVGSEQGEFPLQTHHTFKVRLLIYQFILGYIKDGNIRTL
ncbi:UNKNOWN [Stylonychia lemnae]|uniref:PX domain-containing protein n=1 Tax=Stylonychia lemnae TaxID=5949 RepID=A0A078A3Y0_STYLE|nr:UNKNOWN [Stylonychia lemnae]|eukprot:CDW76968.1 UNKNOWN [Stylonychia lemnae]